MSTRNAFALPSALLLTVALLSTGCATKSEPLPPLVEKPIKLSDVPPSLQQIDSRPSELYLLRVSNWLQRVQALSSGETQK